MTQGILLFAYNNEEIDYGILAVGTAVRIKKFLGKPVTLITDSITIDSLDKTLGQWRVYFDKIIIKDSEGNNLKRYLDVGKELSFHNLNRIHSWELTPYDETIVMDVDILIQSSQLNKLWSNNEELIFCKNSRDIIDRPSDEFNFISQHSAKFFWATVFYFKKTEYTKIFFDTCKKIKENYLWYSHLYGLQSGAVRNDYIWSIALHELGGRENTKWASMIPWTLLYSTPKDNIVNLGNEEISILTKDTPLIVKIKGLDIHIMNKKSLSTIIKDTMELENV